MKIFDCFLFYNELELLELRFEVLWNVIDKFIIVEANKTFSGKDKPFNYELNKEKFTKYIDKIVYVKVEDSPAPKSKINFWNVEYFQRNCIMRGLKQVAQIGDFVLIADADEIIKPDTLLNSLKYDEWISFEQNLYYYYVNLKQNKNFVGPVIAKYGTFRTPEELRQSRHKIKIIADGGWHFSFLGGAERIREKISSYSETHTNNKNLQNIDSIDYMIRSKKDIFGRKKVHYSLVPIDDKLPSYIQVLINKYPYLLFNPELESSNIEIREHKFSLAQNISTELRSFIIKLILKFKKYIIKRKFI